MKIICILLFVSFVYNPQNVFAHTLKSSGSVGAVMHIQPEDDPIAGEESSFFFEFKDKKSLFTPQGCECTFFILQDGQELYTQPLFQNSHDASLTNASVFYTFPQTGVYKVRVDGKPSAGGNFEPFTLEYDVRVERTSESQGSSQNNNSSANYVPHIIGGLIGLAALVVLVVSQRKKQKED